MPEAYHIRTQKNRLVFYWDVWYNDTSKKAAFQAVQKDSDVGKALAHLPETYKMCADKVGTALNPQMSLFRQPILLPHLF